MKHFLAALLVVGSLAGACGGGSKAPPVSAPVTTDSITGPLTPGLINGSQLRRVPGLQTAVVNPIQNIDVLRDPDPRGPCGGVVPVLPFDDAVGLAWSGKQVILGGAQIVIRRPAGDAEAYLNARTNDATAGCPIYQTKNLGGIDQQVKLDRIVRLPVGIEQGLAVVTAIKIGDTVRAATQIEVRRGDVVSRAVVFSVQPLPGATVRGLGALMFKLLLNLT